MIFINKYSEQIKVNGLGLIQLPLMMLNNTLNNNDGMLKVLVE